MGVSFDNLVPTAQCYVPSNVPRHVEEEKKVETPRESSLRLTQGEITDFPDYGDIDLSVDFPDFIETF